MKKMLKKWSLWACGLFVALGLGGGVCVATLNTLQEASITANAATTYEVNSLTVSNSGATASAINAYPNDGSGKPEVGSWDYAYTVQEGTGAGLTLNGEALPNGVIKFPNDFYIGLGKDAVNGDVLIIDGTFYNATTDTYFVFNHCALRYNGSTWESCTAVALGSVTASGDADTLTLTSGVTLTSGKNLELVKGGITVNGDNANTRVQSIVTTANGIIFTATMDDAVADVVFMCGLYTDGTTYYAISDSYFMWEGSSWRTLTGYAAIIDKAVASNTMAQSASGFYIPIKSDTGISDWAATSIVSGHGLKLNGKALAEGVIKFYYDTVYVDLATTAKAGDVLTINGLYQHATGCKVLFAPTQALRYNGSTWEHISYTTYDLDAMVVHASSANAGSATTKADNLYLARADAGWIPVNSSSVAFTYESGANVKKNGSVISYTMKSVGGNVFLEFDSVSEGDIISIGGTFVCESQNTRYAIKDSYFKWDGSAWTESDAHYTQTIADNANIEMDGASNFYLALPTKLVFGDWSAFTLQSGDGITLNTKKIDGAVLKATGDNVYVETASQPIEGDLLMIDGTYTLTKDGTTEEIVFAKTQVFTYNGSQWEISLASLCDLGSMTVASPSYNGGDSTRHDHLYLNSAVTLPVQSWENEDAFTFERGDGLKVNGNPVAIYEIKSTNAGFWMSFEGVNNGDVVTLSGSFINNSYRYLISESTFWWVDGKWADYNYTEQTLSGVIATNDSSASAVYFTGAGVNEKFTVTDGSWSEKLSFVDGSGVGVTINGTQISMGDIKIPGDMYVGLGTTAQERDTLVISGTFYNTTLKVLYVIPESTFMWIGGKWQVVKHTEITGKLVATEGDSANALNLFKADGTDFATEGDWAEKLSFVSGSGCGVVFAGNQIASPDMARPKQIYLGLGRSANVGDTLKIGGTFYSNFSVKYVITETTLVWTGSAWVDYDTVVSVSYDGGSSEFVEKGSEYQLSTENTSESTFIGWLVGNTVYQAGETITIGEESLAFTKLALDFVLKEGAAIRLSNTADDSGIRFTSMINTQQLNALAGYGLTVVYGTLIMPNDYLSNGQAPNLSDFVAGSTVLQIPNEKYREEIGAYTVYYGAMRKLYTTNYHRDFAGRGYMIVTYANGSTKTIYTPFSVKDNVRSVRTVAQKFKEDEAEYSKISDTKKAVVEAYISGVTTSNVNATATVASVQEGYAAAYVYANKQNYLA